MMNKELTGRPRRKAGLLEGRSASAERPCRTECIEKGYGICLGTSSCSRGLEAHENRRECKNIRHTHLLVADCKSMLQYACPHYLLSLHAGDPLDAECDNSHCR